MTRNYGILSANPAPCGSEATIVVTGLGRSGTTAAARVLVALGLFMGDDLSPKSCEDRLMQSVIKSQDWPALNRIGRERDASYAKWGFKFPGARNRLPQIVPILRSPRLIVLFRDPVAIGERERISEWRPTDTSPVERAWKATEETSRLLKTLAGLEAPALLVSYEKALLRPRQTVAALAEFCGLPYRAQAVRAIRRDDPTYLGKRKWWAPWQPVPLTRAQAMAASGQGVPDPAHPHGAPGNV